MGGRPPDPPEIADVALEETRPTPNLDSLATALSERAGSLPPTRLAALEAEIRDWLARLEFEDPALLPAGREAGPYFRHYRGRLLDALGWASYRRGDLRGAEAALVSAVAEIHNRGARDGYARHFLHLGQVYAARGRQQEAIEAYLDAEARGLGAEATPALETMYRRRHGSLAGLDRLRARERSRIEDERRQALVADALSAPLPAFRWPRRTGPPLASRELIGSPFVLAVWGPACSGCGGYAGQLAPLAARLQDRGRTLAGIWLGADPAAAGPTQRYPVLVPASADRARERLRADSLPHILVVDEHGWIRYRWSGDGATPPPIDDILIQVDHLIRRMR